MKKLLDSYCGLEFVIKLILQIFFGWFIGIFARLTYFVEDKNTTSLIYALLGIPFGFIFWILDLVSLIVDKEDFKYLCK